MRKKEKIFVLDTSVLLHDFDAIVNFKEHFVAIPITVLEELDKFKIGNDTKNFSAREVIRFIQERRKSDGFDISDRIDVSWNGVPEIVEAIGSDQRRIETEVLAVTMVHDSTLAVTDMEIGLEVVLTKTKVV